MSVGNNIKVLRQGAGLTQKDLADELNVSFQSISKWETDEVEPDISTLNKLAGIFKVSLDELINSTFSSVSQKSDVVKTEETVRTAKKYIGEPLKSEKSKGMKLIMFLGLFLTIIGFIVVIIGGVNYGSNGGTHAIINAGGKTSVINSDVDGKNLALIIVGLICMAFGLVGFIFEFLSRKDFIEIKEDGVVGYANRKPFKFVWDEIKAANAVSFALILIRNNGAKQIIIFNIKESDKFAIAINKTLNNK